MKKRWCERGSTLDILAGWFMWIGFAYVMIRMVLGLLGVQNDL